MFALLLCICAYCYEIASCATAVPIRTCSTSTEFPLFPFIQLFCCSCVLKRSVDSCCPVEWRDWCPASQPPSGKSTRVLQLERRKQELFSGGAAKRPTERPESELKYFGRRQSVAPSTTLHRGGRECQPATRTVWGLLFSCGGHIYFVSSWA